MENTNNQLQKFEIVDCGPYRFIGKSMYARAGKSGELCGALWKSSDWIFKKLDNLTEYTSDNTCDSALVAWDKYDDKNKLMGYTVGRFMKADTPVPDDMDFLDIPKGYVVKGFIKGSVYNDDIGLAYDAVKAEIEKQGKYRAATWIWSAEMYPKPDENGDSHIGVCIACIPK